MSVCVGGEAPMSVCWFAESLFTIRCVVLWGSSGLEAGSEWQVEKKEQTAERRRGTMYVLVIQPDEWRSDRVCVLVTACVQSTSASERAEPSEGTKCFIFGSSSHNFSPCVKKKKEKSNNLKWHCQEHF